MPTISELVDSIANRTRIPSSVVFQASRRCREDELLPTSCGSRAARVKSEHVALLLLASMATPSANAATRTAITYGQLTYQGAARPDENDEAPMTLLRHLTGLIESALNAERKPISFVELTLDLSVPAASTKLNARVSGNDLTIHSNFVAAGEDVKAWSNQFVRREITLPAEAFYGIIADIKAADKGGQHVGR